MNVLLVAGLTACASAPIGGAPAGARPLTFSQPVAGVLSETDPTLSERGHFHVYAFDGTRGQRVRVMMSSNAFDTYLSVARNVGGLTDVVGTDDGGAGGTDSRVMLTLPEDGTYLVLAQAYGAGEVGSYLLEAALLADAVEMPPQPLQIGQRVQGELSASDRLMDDGSYYDLFTFQAREDDRVAVTLRSSDFDAYLALGRRTDGDFEMLESDDDGAGNRDARILTTLPADGEYVIRANSLSSAEVGPYVLELEPRATPGPAVPRPVAANTTMSGTLRDGDAELEDGSYYDLWTYRGAAGERLRIVLRSEEFDTFLAVGRMENGEFEPLASDDDGAGDTDSMIEVTLDEAGEYTIRANAYQAGQGGDYSLRVDVEDTAEVVARRAAASTGRSNAPTPTSPSRLRSAMGVSCNPEARAV